MIRRCLPLFTPFLQSMEKKHCYYKELLLGVVYNPYFAKLIHFNFKWLKITNTCICLICDQTFTDLDV